MSKESYHKIYEEFYGVEIPDGFHIHHRDFNHFNDDPLNLEMLVNSEHSRIHMLDKIKNSKTWKSAQEARMKSNTIWLGKNHKPESIEAIRESSTGNTNVRGRVWVNNGVVSRMVYLDQIPEGFILGRILSEQAISNLRRNFAHVG